jgi:hypothetical protein
LVAPLSIKLKRFCKTSIGGAHGHENLKIKTRNKEDMASI